MALCDESVSGRSARCRDARCIGEPRSSHRKRGLPASSRSNASTPVEHRRHPRLVPGEWEAHLAEQDRLVVGVSQLRSGRTGSPHGVEHPELRENSAEERSARHDFARHLPSYRGTSAGAPGSSARGANQARVARGRREFLAATRTPLLRRPPLEPFKERIALAHAALSCPHEQGASVCMGRNAPCSAVRRLRPKRLGASLLRHRGLTSPGRRASCYCMRTRLQRRMDDITAQSLSGSPRPVRPVEGVSPNTDERAVRRHGPTVPRGYSPEFERTPIRFDYGHVGGHNSGSRVDDEFAYFSVGYEVNLSTNRSLLRESVIFVAATRMRVGRSGTRRCTGLRRA